MEISGRQILQLSILDMKQTRFYFAPHRPPSECFMAFLRKGLNILSLVYSQSTTKGTSHGIINTKKVQYTGAEFSQWQSIQYIALHYIELQSSWSTFDRVFLYHKAGAYRLVRLLWFGQSFHKLYYGYSYSWWSCRSTISVICLEL